MTYDSIPLPNFSLSSYVENAAIDLYNGRIKPEYYDFNTSTEWIQELLWEHSKKEYQIVILGVLINKLTTELTEHTKVCKGIGCSIEKDIRRLLVYLYGKLDECGIEIPSDLFSEEEITKFQELLATIVLKLDEVVVENPALAAKVAYVKEKVEETVNFIYLGKEKALRFLLGALANLGLEKSLESLLPFMFHLIVGYFNTSINLLDNISKQ